LFPDNFDKSIYRPRLDTNKLKSNPDDNYGRLPAKRNKYVICGHLQGKSGENAGKTVEQLLASGEDCRQRALFRFLDLPRKG
jgi:hypothetical protein